LDYTVAFANTCVTLERLRLSSGRPIALCAQRNLRRPSRRPLHGETTLVTFKSFSSASFRAIAIAAAAPRR
jgi:hypothetical protein